MFNNLFSKNWSLIIAIMLVASVFASFILEDFTSQFKATIIKRQIETVPDIDDEVLSFVLEKYDLPEDFDEFKEINENIYLFESDKDEVISDNMGFDLVNYEIELIADESIYIVDLAFSNYIDEETITLDTFALRLKEDIQDVVVETENETENVQIHYGGGGGQIPAGNTEDIVEALGDTETEDLIESEVTVEETEDLVEPEVTEEETEDLVELEVIEEETEDLVELEVTEEDTEDLVEPEVTEEDTEDLVELEVSEEDTDDIVESEVLEENIEDPLENLILSEITTEDNADIIVLIKNIKNYLYASEDEVVEIDTESSVEIPDVAESATESVVESVAETAVDNVGEDLEVVLPAEDIIEEIDENIILTEDNYVEDVLEIEVPDLVDNVGEDAEENVEEMLPAEDIAETVVTVEETEDSIEIESSTEANDLVKIKRVNTEDEELKLNEINILQPFNIFIKDNHLIVAFHISKVDQFKSLNIYDLQAKNVNKIIIVKEIALQENIEEYKEQNACHPVTYFYANKSETVCVSQKLHCYNDSDLQQDEVFYTLDECKRFYNLTSELSPKEKLDFAKDKDDYIYRLGKLKEECLNSFSKYTCRDWSKFIKKVKRTVNYDQLAKVGNEINTFRMHYEQK